VGDGLPKEAKDAAGAEEGEDEEKEGKIIGSSFQQEAQVTNADQHM
jgi:hypothetical protein